MALIFSIFFQDSDIPAYTTNLKRDHVQDNITPFKDILILSWLKADSLLLARGPYFLFPFALADNSEGFSNSPDLTVLLYWKWITWLNYETYFYIFHSNNYAFCFNFISFLLLRILEHKDHSISTLTSICFGVSKFCSIIISIATRWGNALTVHRLKRKTCCDRLSSATGLSIF